jgi:hypothetical protein
MQNQEYSSIFEIHIAKKTTSSQKKILQFLTYILLKRLPVLSFSGGKLQSSALGIVGA